MSTDNNNTTEQTNSNNALGQKRPLTTKDLEQLQGAINRFAELAGQAIETPNKQAEMAGLVTFIKNSLFTSAAEFIGCWWIVHNEYQPLLQGIRSIFSRNRFMDQMEAQARAQAAQQQTGEPQTGEPGEQPANVTPLIQPATR